MGPSEEHAELIPARMVNEVLYCERLYYLEACQKEFDDNVFTVEGRWVHRRADAGSGRLPERARGSGEPEPVASEVEERPYTARSVWLTSESLGLTAKIDVVEVEGGAVIPVEYKRGGVPRIPEQAYPPERAQVCAHVLLLREHGYTCTHGELYFAEDRRRVTVEISDELVAMTVGAIARARDLARAATLPPPLRDSPKCHGCSLAGICLPDELNFLALERPAEELQEGGEGDEERGAEEAVPPKARIRLLYAEQDDRVPLYVQSHKARISVAGELLEIKDDATRATARLPNTSQVAIFGNAQLTTQALRALLERNIPVSFFTFGGWFLGRAVSHDTKNVELRIAQHRAAADAGFSLRLARRLVASKILNCRTMLRRNHSTPDPVGLRELRTLAAKALRVEEQASLLGVEGAAARLYFQAFAGMLKVGGRPVAFDFESRNRRPPKDPINAMLSFVYALLAKDLSLALVAVGLDPLLGFYHRPRYGRPGLALDMMEEFRPLIADSVVLTAINTGVIQDADFIRAAGSCSMSASARRALLGTYERRMEQLVTHPIFEYRLSYRRVLELQARLLSRVILGELPDYPSFRTR